MTDNYISAIGPQASGAVFCNPAVAAGNPEFASLIAGSHITIAPNGTGIMISSTSGISYNNPLLGSPVTLTSANTLYPVLTQAVTDGTYIVFGQVMLYNGNASQGTGQIRLSKGSGSFSTSQQSVSPGLYSSFSCMGIVTISGSDTITLSAEADNTGWIAESSGFDMGPPTDVSSLLVLNITDTVTTPPVPVPLGGIILWDLSLRSYACPF